MNTPIEQNEFYPNGELAYTQTIVIISKEEKHLYPNYRKMPNGEYYIRVGRCAKYYDNGQLGWQINYDSDGNPIRENLPSYRKNGQIIK